MRTSLTLHTRPEAPLEAECISPQCLEALSENDIEHRDVMHGNRQAKVGDFFTVRREKGSGVYLEGDLSQVKLIGKNMSAGSLTIDGDVGMHLGCAMTGGVIHVNGNASDWVGPEMSGGRITIKGNAGHMVGCAYRGDTTGIKGGEILIHGNARNEVGGGMRRGLIAIGGNAGDFAGVNMLAGTIIAFGELGIRTGAGMKRGSIISFRQADILPTFEYACTYRPLFLRLYLLHLRSLGFPVEDSYLDDRYQRWSGDALESSRGEILLLSEQVRQS